MHIVENTNRKSGRIYCYADECIWNKETHEYDKPRTPVGHLKDGSRTFVPNRSFAMLLLSQQTTPNSITEYEKMVIDTVKGKYGDCACQVEAIVSKAKAQTAWVEFSGPSIIFGGITARYRIEAKLKKAFGEEDAKAILSLAWYIASEGDALSNSDVWLEQFQNPTGCALNSREITRLLDRVETDGIMTFYKEWLGSIERAGDKALYDLTSISWYGQGLNMAAWGHNRDNEDLPQVNYALLCARNTGMPLFAWPLDGSISDVRTLKNTLQYLKKLDYMPDCLMMDRGFGSKENISFMLENGYTFFQALRINADWIHDIIDAGNDARLLPSSALRVGDRTFYANTLKCQWVHRRWISKKGIATEERFVYICSEQKGEKYLAKESEEILSQYPCTAHVLFCQDLIGNQWDRFMEKLNAEYERLLADEKSIPPSGLKRYFVIEKKKWARKRSVEFSTVEIAKHRNNYAGYICFLTNDKTIPSSEIALKEYSTRDYIEKDFDEMKNDLDMRRLRVHTDGRMKARLFIQFIAEIYLKEIRTRLRSSKECQKMTRKQISTHIKGIYKVKFTGKYKDVCPELSKSQRSILQALDICDSR